MKVDEAQRITTMMRKMTETRHQDEATAVLSQLHRRAALHGKSLDLLVAEAESTLRGDAKRKPIAHPKPPPATAPEPAPVQTAPRRARPTGRSATQDDETTDVRRLFASWQDTLLLILLLGIVFYAAVFGRDRAPEPIREAPAVTPQPSTPVPFQ